MTVFLSDDFAQRYAAQINRLMVVRRDFYREKLHRRSGLTDEIILRAARSETYVALHPCGENGCGWLCFDLDNKKGDLEARNDQLAFLVLAELGAGAILEKSGPGSYHAWKFFSPQPIENVVAFNFSILEKFQTYIEKMPIGQPDKYPSKYTAVRIPGLHPIHNTPAKLWDVRKQDWIEYGTTEFVELWERVEIDRQPAFPIAAPWVTSGGYHAAGIQATSDCAWKKNEGPKLWAKIHKAALTDTATFTDILINSILPMIGCAECKDEAKEFLKEYPIGNDCFAWTVDWHNNVNEKLGKPTLSVEEARQAWS